MSNDFEEFKRIRDIAKRQKDIEDSRRENELFWQRGIVEHYKESERRLDLPEWFKSWFNKEE